MEKKCSECKYWKGIKAIEDAEPVDGECKYNAPLLVEGLVWKKDGNRWALWPLTGCDDWCGKFEQ